MAERVAELFAGTPLGGGTPVDAVGDRLRESIRAGAAKVSSFGALRGRADGSVPAVTSTNAEAWDFGVVRRRRCGVGGSAWGGRFTSRRGHRGGSGRDRRCHLTVAKVVDISQGSCLVRAAILTGALTDVVPILRGTFAAVRVGLTRATLVHGSGKTVTSTGRHVGDGDRGSTTGRGVRGWSTDRGVGVVATTIAAMVTTAMVAAPMVAASIAATAIVAATLVAVSVAAAAMVGASMVPLPAATVRPALPGKPAGPVSHGGSRREGCD